MKIYFAAHGTTYDNANGIASGWKDDELSELGVSQAKALGERFKDIHLDYVCSSDLKRAVDTVKIAFSDRLPVIIDKRLRELNYGDFNGKPKGEVDSLKLKSISKPFPNGESYEQAVARNQGFYRELEKKYPHKTILVVGHRATQYGLDTLINHKGIEELLKTPFVWQPYWEYKY